MLTISPRFKALMQREWLQYRLGWLVLMALPPLLALGLGVLGFHSLDVQIDNEVVALPDLAKGPAVLWTLGLTLGVAVLAFVFATVAVVFQLGSLARRDRSDRSIEFWRSLPNGDAQSLAAMLLMHLLVLPAAAVLVGVLAAQWVALLLVMAQQGPMAFLNQPWALMLPILAVGSARLLLGLALAMAWLSPLLVLMMLAAVWLKRWGAPLVTLALVLGVRWLDPRLPVPLVQPILHRLSTEALTALASPQSFKGLQIHAPNDVLQALPDLPGWLLRDAGYALNDAASPAFLMALAVAAAGFALLVWQRQRTA